MRGKVTVQGDAMDHSGITPAYAGKSEADVQFLFHSLGSPPPMRGKVPQFYFSQTVYRITPAYAGKRVKKSAMQSAGQDHPRLCGEKVAKCSPEDTFDGSPPPMRGKGSLKNPVTLEKRITPAYAGKSDELDLLKYACKDHPRLCGEKVELLQSRRRYAGSPPPMRGKATKRFIRLTTSGITPAYAGKSAFFQIGYINLEGSPPPMRGKG